MVTNLGHTDKHRHICISPNTKPLKVIPDRGNMAMSFREQDSTASGINQNGTEEVEGS
jgi:hypothetical protein